MMLTFLEIMLINENCDTFPSRDCLNVLHAVWKHAGYFFKKKNMENSGSIHGNIL